MKKVIGATLKEVARRSEVSIATASIVLRDGPDAKRFSEETSNRIRAIAKELNYKPSFFSSQNSKVSHKILVLYRSSVEDLASDSVADSFLKRALERGYKTIISVGRLQKNNYLLDSDLIGTRGITSVGVIAGSSSISDRTLIEAAKQGINIVIMGRRIESKLISQVFEDNYSGVNQAANYIYSQGVKSIWIICPPKSTVHYSHSGIEAFSDCAKKLGKPEPKYIYVPLMPTSHSTAITSYEIFSQELEKNKHPDAVFGTNDTLIYPVMRVLNEKGFKVGKDISVVGYGDLWPSEVMMTSLTTVHLPFKETGSVAADILIDIAENKIKIGRKIILMPQLIIRDSGKFILPNSNE